MDLPDFLIQDPDGEICLRGHRIRAIEVAALYDKGLSAEAIALDYFPTIPLPLIHKVIAFFLENEVEIRRMIRENAEAMARLEASTPSRGPSHSELRNRIAARRRAEAS